MANRRGHHQEEIRIQDEKWFDEDLQRALRKNCKNLNIPTCRGKEALGRCPNGRIMTIL